MGFFKNLIQGRFKRIGQNAVKNLSEGKIMKGTGFDSIVNGAANVATGGMLSTVGDAVPTLDLKAMERAKEQAEKKKALIAQQSTKQAPLSPQNKDNKNEKEDSFFSFFDNSSGVSPMLIIGGGVLLLFILKKRK